MESPYNWNTPEHVLEALRLCLAAMNTHGNTTNWDCGIHAEYARAMNLGNALLKDDWALWAMARGHFVEHGWLEDEEPS